MKTKEQQELCSLLDTFRETKEGKDFQNLLTGLFKCPLLLPQAKGENKGDFIIANHNQQKVLPGFTHMEAIDTEKLVNADFNAYTIEEYARILSALDVQGIILNIFDGDTCIINKDFFVNVIIPAFKENRIMPGLKYIKTGDYIPVTKMPYSIGRSKQADLTIADNTINELHGLLIEREGKYYVVDRDSVNGIYVNGNRVDKEQEIVFDDVIEFYEEEFLFVPMGLAERKDVTKSVYGNDLHMIANAMFFMQNNILVKEFIENSENFLQEIQAEDPKESYRKYFLIALETTCKIKENELKIEDPKVIEDQRKAMLGRGITIFNKNDYGITPINQGELTVYQIDFPEVLFIPGLAKRMYLVQKESGERAAYIVRIMQDKVYLVKVDMENQESNCGEAPATAEEELQKVFELGV